jgi:16S rRNA (adenine1518-N6/adenine1519-N6)-dimethyltransferase
MSNLFNPRDLQSLCQKCHLLPSKKYGQNYLIDPVVIETIIEHSELSPHDIVAEVGPGFR